MFLQADPYSTKAQMILILLATMRDLKGGHSKSQVISQIESNKWFDRQQEDNNPYPSVKTNEARWKTLIAFRRKDCYEEELFERDEIRDSWQISKSGLNCLAIRRQQFEDYDLDCRKCYMWSGVFKQFMCSSYSPSDLDAERPSTLYTDYHNRQMSDKLKAFIDGLL